MNASKSGKYLTVLDLYRDVIAGAFVAPERFEEVLAELPSSHSGLLRSFSQSFGGMLSDSQKRQWKFVILGVEQGTEESTSARKGGLIAGDNQLLLKFLAEADLVPWLDGQLQSESLRRALASANAEWCRRFSVDEEYARIAAATASWATPRASFSNTDFTLNPLSSPSAYSAAAGLTNASSPTNEEDWLPEAKVMWLQELSWQLKYERPAYRPLVRWRLETVRVLSEFCAALAAKQRAAARSSS
eukprot:RCo018098